VADHSSYLASCLGCHYLVVHNPFYFDVMCYTWFDEFNVKTCSVVKHVNKVKLVEMFVDVMVKSDLTITKGIYI
jgi:hypothetical protein